MAAQFPPQGNSASGWIRAVIEDDARQVDIDRTVALWIAAGLDANDAWFELTRERRQHARWGQVRRWMQCWARRDHRLERAQLSLPGLDRRAA